MNTQPPIRPTAREKRDRHLGEAARRASEIAHHGSRVAAIRAKIKKARDRGRDCANHLASLRKAEATLAAKKKAHAYATRAAGKLERAALRADAALSGIKLSRPKPAASVELSRSERRLVEKARERRERDIANKKRQMRSLGLDDNLLTAAGRREFDVEDDRKFAVGGGRKRTRIEPESMFEDRSHATPWRIACIKRFQEIWYGAHEEAHMPNPNANIGGFVDKPISQGRPPEGAACQRHLGRIRAALGGVITDRLIAERVIGDHYWRDLIEEFDLPRRQLGRIFRDSIDIIIRVLAVPDPQAATTSRIIGFNDKELAEQEGKT